MSNSSLVDYTKLSPNKSTRQGKISKITIHHTAGVINVEALGNVFQPKSRQASSNYGVDSDGRVGMYVEEKDRSWASSNASNDHVAVTIEVSNDGGANWHVSDKALQKTIELCADICKRNGIEKLNFTGDKTGNLTMHKYFAATACPGEYLESKFPYIADEVNKILSGNKKEALKELTTANDIVWELGEMGIVLDKEGMLKEMNDNPDGRLYWLARKMLNYIRQKGI
jgi:hypothetical protein